MLSIEYLRELVITFGRAFSGTPHWLTWVPGAAATLVFAAIAWRSLRAARKANEMTRELAIRQDTVRLKNQITEQMTTILDLNVELIEHTGINYISEQYLIINSKKYMQAIHKPIAEMSNKPLFTSNFKIVYEYYKAWHNYLIEHIAIISGNVENTSLANYRPTHTTVNSTIHSLREIGRHLRLSFEIIAEYSTEDFQKRLKYEKESIRSFYSRRDEYESKQNIKINNVKLYNLLTRAIKKLNALERYTYQPQDFL